MYLFIHCWLNLLSYCVKFCCTHRISLRSCFPFFWVYNQKWNWWFIRWIFFEETQYYLHSYQQSTSIPVSPHLWQYLISACFCFIIAILMGMKWCLMVSIYISLVINNNEHLFLCLMAICISTLQKQMSILALCLFFESSGLFCCCWVLGVRYIVLNIRDINPLSDR